MLTNKRKKREQIESIGICARAIIRCRPRNVIYEQADFGEL